MRLQENVKPISYVKAHAAEILRDVTENGATFVITQNGEAKAVLQDIAEYEQIQESLALLKILALGRKAQEEGRMRPAAEAFAAVKARIQKRRAP